LHLSKANLNFWQFQAGPANSPVIKKTGATHQHTAPAIMILLVSVRKGEKNKKRISSRSSLQSKHTAFLAFFGVPSKYPHDQMIRETSDIINARI
jgi:hypothetical protein